MLNDVCETEQSRSKKEPEGCKFNNESKSRSVRPKTLVKENPTKGISNNNATLVNPDSSKYVLTTYGDISILGKRKSIQESSTTEDDSMNLGDGIVLDVDTQEFDFEDDLEPEGPINQNFSSSDEEVQLGKSAEDVVNVEVPGPSLGGNLDEEERQLLKEHPQVENILSHLLDKRLKQILPQTNSSGIGNVNELKSMGKSNTPKTKMRKNGTPSRGNQMKSPSDTTIYVPALLKQVTQAVRNVAIDNE